MANHSACGTDTPRYLPNRVLDLGEEENPQHVKLLLTRKLSNNDPANYVALSHCWGPPNAVPKTTRENLQSNLEGIKISDLPETFRDTILLTRAVGIKYLWIDSMCIIQDDHSDWEVESSLMAEIYSNATLTIAATGSRDGHGGCFFDRWSYQMNPPFPISMESLTMHHQFNGSPHVIHVRPVLSAHAAFLTAPGVLDRSPALMRRAWAFQERLISPRIIHFHHEELVWECQTSLVCECGWKGEKGEWQLNEPFKIRCAEILRDMGTRSWPRLSMKAKRDRWPQIVSRYSELALTFDADRLPALSGLASRLASTMGLDYLAGLWKSDLERLLGWARVVPKEESTIGRTLRCSAPTPPLWSWASITSTVRGKPEAVYFPTAHPYREIVLECRAIESSCSLAGADQFGAVSGGHILIEGRIIPAELKHDHDKGDIHNISFDEAHSTLFLTDISCETLYQLKPEPVQVLLLGSLLLDFAKPHAADTDGASNLFGSNNYGDFVLVLREIEGEKYERVGLAILENEWQLFKEVSVSKITLV